LRFPGVYCQKGLIKRAFSREWCDQQIGQSLTIHDDA